MRIASGSVPVTGSDTIISPAAAGNHLHALSRFHVGRSAAL